MLRFYRLAVLALALTVSAAIAINDTQAHQHGPKVHDTYGVYDCAQISFFVDEQLDAAYTEHNGKDLHRVRTEATKINGWCNANQRRCRKRFEAKYHYIPGEDDAVFRYDFEYAWGPDEDRSVIWWIDCMV